MYETQISEVNRASSGLEPLTTLTSEMSLFRGKDSLNLEGNLSNFNLDGTEGPKLNNYVPICHYLICLLPFIRC